MSNDASARGDGRLGSTISGIVNTRPVASRITGFGVGKDFTGAGAFFGAAAGSFLAAAAGSFLADAAGSFLATAVGSFFVAAAGSFFGGATAVFFTGARGAAFSFRSNSSIAAGVAAFAESTGFGAVSGRPDRAQAHANTIAMSGSRARPVISSGVGDN